MKFNEESSTNSHIIQSYNDSEIIIDGKVFSSSFIISKNTLIESWPVADISQLESDHLKAILDMRPEVILIGTGQKLVFPSPQSYVSVINQGMGIEFMDSGAACRTYNVLVSEGRNVVTAIIL